MKDISEGQGNLKDMITRFSFGDFEYLEVHRNFTPSIIFSKEVNFDFETYANNYSENRKMSKFFLNFYRAKSAYSFDTQITLMRLLKYLCAHLCIY